MADFGEDAVVSLRKYFWSKKDKAILKKGSKRTREGILKHVPTLDQIVWRTDDPNEKQGALDTTAVMGAFAGASYNSVSQLTKDLLSKKHELQKARKDLEAAEARRLKDIELLKQEHQDKLRQSKKKIGSLKHQLEKSEVSNKQQANHNATLEQQLKEL